MTAGTTVSYLIRRLVAFVLRHAVLTTVAMLALCVAGLWYTVTPGHLRINTDTANMISADLPWRQDFAAFRENFPARDGNIAVVIDADTPDRAASFARALGDRLRAEPALFPSVFLGRDSEFFARNGLLYLSLDELYDLDARLTGAQAMLARLAADTSGAAIIEALAEVYERNEPLPAGSAAALGAMVTDLDATLSAAAGNDRRPIDWGGLFGNVAGSSTRHLLLVRPADDARRIPAKATIDRLHEIRDELAMTYGDSVEMRLTGTPAMEYEELTAIVGSAELTGFAALAMVIVVLLWFLRSLRLLAISLVTLLAGLSLTASFAAVTVGELNLLSVAFAVLYVGLGVDFILHLLLRLEELQRRGEPLHDAMLETARGVGASLVICAATTAVGFFAFIPTDFIGISSLGLIAGGGMVISLIVSLTLLPALLVLTTPTDFIVRPQARRSGLRLPTLPPRVVCAGAAVLVLIAIWYLPPVFDGNPVNLRDPDAESVIALNELATDSEAPVFSLAVVTPDAAAARALATQFAGVGSVHSVQTVDDFVPADQDEKLDSVIDFLAAEFGPTLAQVTSNDAGPDRLYAAVDRLIAALNGADRTDAAEQRLLRSAVAWRAGAGTTDAAAANAARALDRDVSGNLVDVLGRLRTSLQAKAFGRDDLPPELRERWINAAGQQLVEIVPAENLNDRDAASRFVADVHALAPDATGLPVVYQKAAETVTQAFTQALTYAFVAVAVMLLLFLRSAYATLMVMLPIVFAAVVTAGFSAMIGLDLNFANIIALPLLVGIGVDSGIHVVHRMRTEPPKDGDPLHTSTSRAVFASALTTVASFGNLAFAAHVGMASMGQLLTLGMIMSLVSVLILLPALLQVGRFR